MTMRPADVSPKVAWTMTPTEERANFRHAADTSVAAADGNVDTVDFGGDAAAAAFAELRHPAGVNCPFSLPFLTKKLSPHYSELT